MRIPARVFEGISLSHPSSLAPLSPGGRNGREQNEETGLRATQTWFVFRVFREINPLVHSTYTRGDGGRQLRPVSAYTHGISIIWIVKVFGRQLQPPEFMQPTLMALVPATRDDNARLSLKADFTRGKYRRDAHSSREFKLECSPSN